LLFGGIASIGLLSPLAISTSADAHEYYHWHHGRHYFRVYYHDPCLLDFGLYFSDK
jgi:hypothetical protein